MGPPPQVAKNGPFAQRPYNGFISAVTGSILQFLAFWAFISLHFGLVGLHFLAFWPCGPSFPCIFWPCGPLFPCILALCAFISFHFGPLGSGGGILLGCSSFISFHFGLLGLHFLSFWLFVPSFPFILAFWAFISYHFGVLGLHFLSFWPFGLPIPFILVLGPLEGVSFTSSGLARGASPQVARHPLKNDIFT